MAIRVSIRPGPNFAAEILAGLQEVFDNELKTIMEKRSAEAVGRVQKNVSGIHTDQPVLRIRSGQAVTSMDAELEEAPLSLTATVGAVSAPPDVEQYLNVQEYGQTIFPVNAEKLAFPPGENWHPATRDASGTQILTAKELLQDPRAYGFSAVQFTEKAILGIDEFSGFPELLFVRRSSVEIPARRPVGREQDRMVEDITRDLADLVVR